MSDSLPLPRTPNGSRLLLASSAVLATAGVVGMVGLGLATLALVSIARHRISRMDQPPMELARRQWRQARAAVAAGAGAWRDDTVARPVGEPV